MTVSDEQQRYPHTPRVRKAPVGKTSTQAMAHSLNSLLRHTTSMDRTHPYYFTTTIPTALYRTATVTERNSRPTIHATSQKANRPLQGSKKHKQMTSATHTHEPVPNPRTGTVEDNPTNDLMLPLHKKYVRVRWQGDSDTSPVFVSYAELSKAYT